MATDPWLIQGWLDERLRIMSDGNVGLDDFIYADEADVELVWEPLWSRDMMTEAARLELGMM